MKIRNLRICDAVRLIFFRNLRCFAVRLLLCVTFLLQTGCQSFRQETEMEKLERVNRERHETEKMWFNGPRQIYP